MRRPTLLLLLAASVALLSVVLPDRSPDARLEQEATRLERMIGERRVALEAFIERALRDPEQHFSRALPEGMHGWWFRDDTLFSWSGTSWIREDSVAALRDDHIVHAGSVLLHGGRSEGRNTLHVLAEIWMAPPFRNAYLRPHFDPSLGAPPGLIAETGPGMGPVVRDIDGDVLFRLAWEGDTAPFSGLDLFRSLLFVLACALLTASVWSQCMAMAKDGFPVFAVLLFVAGIAVLRWISLLYYPIAPFDRLELFGPQLYAASSLLPSLGDLLVNSVLCLVIARFAHIALRPVRVPAGVTGVLIAGLLVGLLLWAGWWITRTFIGLVEDSSVGLDLFHLQDLNAYSALALICASMLFAAWSLFTDAGVRSIMRPGGWMGMAFMFAITLVASIILHDLGGVVDMILVLWPVPLLLAAVFGRTRSYHFGHVLLALVTMAFLGAHILIKYTGHRELNERLALAERSITSNDPVVELLFRETAPRLRHDAGVYALLTDTAPCTATALETRVRQEYFTGYWERYDVRLYAFGTDGVQRCATSSEPARSIAASQAGIAPTPAAVDMPELFIDAAPGERTFYHAQVAVMAGDTTPPVQLVIELHPRIAAEGQGFPELLLNDPGGLARRSGRYAFARYENGVLMEHRGFAFPLYWSRDTDEEGIARINMDGRDLLAYGDRRGSLVVLGVPELGWLDKATTFSWLFAFFSLMLGASLAARALLQRRGIPPLGIGGKVRAALLLFAALGLLFFSVGAERLLARMYGARSDAALLEKSRSLLVELQQKLEGVEALRGEREGYLAHLVVKFSNVFFTDINLYTPAGELLATSRPQVFDSGLLGRRMNALAFEHLAREGRSEFAQVERIGQARYRSAYVPLRDKQGALLAYVNLPSFTRQGELDQERGSLLTAIVNLFVLLLALSLLAGVFISSWTTRPLELLKRGLSRIALQGVNEPINYSGRDEVGELVRVYNRKVEELRESAEKLARSERESAWREMARQVAHEIKNPLTPMKLSIQHFERTWTPEAVDAKDRLRKFSAGLVDQIDVLSRIAGEFSHFAQMPPAHETVLDLREVAEASVSLFASGPNATITLATDGPMHVKADREHLLRVFNNLIKNALQAIPEGRTGKVEVILRGEGREAIAEVRDNGSGIPEEARARIFTPSFTTKSSGMGLGLAMVKRMIDQAGGRVWFEASNRAGASFFIALPLHH